MERQSKVDMSILRKIGIAMYRDLTITEVQISELYGERLHSVLFEDKAGKRVLVSDRDLFFKESSRGIKLKTLLNMAHDYGYISDVMFNEISINRKMAKNHPDAINNVASKLYNEIVMHQAEYDATSSVMHLGYVPKLNLSPELKIVVDNHDVQLTKADVNFIEEGKHTQFEAHMHAMYRAWNGENIVQGPYLDDAMIKSTGLFAIMKDETRRIKKDYDSVAKNLTFNVM
ncbi:MAG: hypothetical protein IK070_00075 [Clostridia bacterium]|nr:hypothetical protein [Clostridia bacterium]